jgi:type I restriction enzyme S subunit
MQNKNWEIARLGVLCDVSMGKTPSRGDKSLWDLAKKSTNIWVSIADLTATKGSHIFNSKEYVSDSGARLFKTVPKGTLLASFKLSLGKLAFAGTELRTNEAIAALKNNETQILNSYLYHYLTFFDWDDYAKEDHKVKGKTLNKEKVQNIQILFPVEKDEQKRIVGILDEKFKAIEELKKVTEAQVQDAKELFESRLNIIFGMSEENILPLSDVCKITSSKRVYKADYVKSGVPFYRTKEIKELAHNKQPTTELFIKRDSFDEITSKFGKPEAGDLMLTAIGTIGEIYIVEDKDEFYFKDGNILWLKNIKGVTVGYLRYALNFFVKEIQSLAVGSAYKALTIEKLNNHKIPVPKKEIQNDTVKELDELSIKTQELMEVFQNKIINLEELKKSYLEQAFAGKL